MTIPCQRLVSRCFFEETTTIAYILKAYQHCLKSSFFSHNCSKFANLYGKNELFLEFITIWETWIEQGDQIKQFRINRCFVTIFLNDGYYNYLITIFCMMKNRKNIIYVECAWSAGPMMTYLHNIQNNRPIHTS